MNTITLLTILAQLWFTGDSITYGQEKKRYGSKDFNFITNYTKRELELLQPIVTGYTKPTNTVFPFFSSTVDLPKAERFTAYHLYIFDMVRIPHIETKTRTNWLIGNGEMISIQYFTTNYTTNYQIGYLTTNWTKVVIMSVDK